MDSELYTTYLICSVISILFSTCMSVMILLNKRFKESSTLHLLLLLAFADIVLCISWLSGDKNEFSETSYVKCCLLDYLYQAGILYKAFFAMGISSISMKTLKNLHFPSDAFCRTALYVIIIVPTLLVILSTALRSADYTCRSDYSFQSNSTYVLVFLCPLYVCVVGSVMYYYMISKRLEEALLILSTVYGANDGGILELSFDAKMSAIYPLIFGLSWCPYVVVVGLRVGGGYQYLALDILSSACIASSGTIISVVYCYRFWTKIYGTNTDRPDCEQDDQSGRMPPTHGRNPMVYQQIKAGNKLDAMRNMTNPSKEENTEMTVRSPAQASV